MQIHSFLVIMVGQNDKTQEEAADALSCNLRTLQRYEQGKPDRKGPPSEMLYKMSLCYQCEIGPLVSLPDLPEKMDLYPDSKSL